MRLFNTRAPPECVLKIFSHLLLGGLSGPGLRRLSGAYRRRRLHAEILALARFRFYRAPAAGEFAF